MWQYIFLLLRRQPGKSVLASLFQPFKSWDLLL